MDGQVKECFAGLESADKNVQYESFITLLAITKSEVEWAYEVWDQLLEDLTDRDNHKRARAGQLLANLAKSDPEKRILNDFPRLWEVTKDPKFVTARHTLQNIWRVGLAGDDQEALVIQNFAYRYKNCLDEKHPTMIRYDIIKAMRNLYNESKNEEIKHLALDLIETEEDEKYRKKYAKEWKNA